MSEYTPTTEEVREAIVKHFMPSNRYNTMSAVEFNRWLTQIKAEAWDEGFDAGIDHAILKDFVFNPYSIKSERAQKYIEKKLREESE